MKIGDTVLLSSGAMVNDLPRGTAYRQPCDEAVTLSLIEAEGGGDVYVRFDSSFDAPKGMKRCLASDVRPLPSPCYILDERANQFGIDGIIDRVTEALKPLGVEVVYIEKSPVIGLKNVPVEFAKDFYARVGAAVRNALNPVGY